MTDRPTFDRRRVLQGIAGTLPAALAGCLGSETSKTYTDWIPASEGFTVAYLDLQEADSDDNAGALVPTLLPSQDAILDGGESGPGAGRFAVDVDTEDPLLGFPVRASSSVLAFASLGVGISGLYELVDGTADQPAHELLFLDGVIVLTGGFDTDYVDERLRSEGPLPQFKVQHQVLGDLGEYTLYGPTDAERDTGSGATVAVNEAAIVLGGDREAVERVVKTHAGERETAPDRFDTVEWLAESVEAGNVVVGQYGEESLDSYGGGDSSVLGTFDPSDDVLASLSLDDTDGTATATLAVAAEGERERQLETTLGQDGTDRSMTTEDGRLTVSATYSDDMLKTMQVVEEDPPDDSDFKPERIDEENRLVTDVSFNDPEEGLAKVTFTDDPAVEFDTIRVESVVGGGETELSGNFSPDFLRVFFDPAGDQVVVTIIHGDTTEVVHRETYEPSE
jgi:hypothetical protein